MGSSFTEAEREKDAEAKSASVMAESLNRFISFEIYGYKYTKFFTHNKTTVK